MGLTSAIVWVVLVAVVVVLVFVALRFSLRTLRATAALVAIAAAVAVTRFGVTHPEYRPADLVDAFLSGVDRVTVAVLYPFWRGQVPVPGVAGRWIIVVAFVLGYRQLEGLALRRQAPELDLSAIGRARPAGHSPGRAGSWLWHRYNGSLAAAERHAELAAELRFRLPTMEVRSPSILPGGSRTNALASIAESSGVSGGGMVGAVVRFAALIWPSPRLFRVRAWMESAAGTRITVLLENVQTGVPMATKTVAGDSFNETASMVTGYIAREIFALDPTVPEWCYGMADGRDLGALQLARLQRFYAPCAREVREARKNEISILTSETGTDRTAGIVRYELAQLLALDDQHLESLRLHALNRELHPRFYRGRYRLAMSLEMIANPEHYLQRDAETEQKLTETLEIISRYTRANGTLQESAKSLWRTPDLVGAEAPAGKTFCGRVPQDLALMLLDIAAQDLGEVRTQLKLRHVLWDAFSRRDERAVWLPHRKRRHRRSFQDGVCVAELLVAIRRRLRQPTGTDPGWLEHARACWYLRRAIRITWCIAGDPSFIYSALTYPHSTWWKSNKARKPRLDLGSLAWARSPSRPRRSASWQAAYNAACLYAALADAAWRGGAADDILQELEHRVIVSLRSVVDNPTSELERAWDWLFGDPDFRVMREHRDKFTAFGKYLDELEREEYPAALLGKCPVPHPNPAGKLSAGRQSANAQSAIFSPVPRPVPVGDGEYAYGAVGTSL